MAPIAPGIFSSIIFSLVEYAVQIRKDPMRWAVWTLPIFFLIAGTICTLYVVYKGPLRLGLADKDAWYIAAATLGGGFGLSVLSALYLVRFVHARVIRNDCDIKLWDVIKGPLLFNEPAPVDAEFAQVPNYAVIPAQR